MERSRLEGGDEHRGHLQGEAGVRERQPGGGLAHRACPHQAGQQSSGHPARAAHLIGQHAALP